MGLMIVIGIVVVLCVFAGMGAWIADQKHRDQGEGLLLGLLFGPFGCLIEAMLPAGPPSDSRSDEMVARFKSRLAETPWERERREVERHRP